MGNGVKATKVLVAMSGGVDSSVAAALLKERGYQVSGVTMRIWDGNELPSKETHHGCYGPGEAEDIEDARKVAGILGIDFHVIDLYREFKDKVLNYFREEYRAGKTPNPCLMCNRHVKFAAMLSRSRDAGIEFDYFATGHHARVEYNEKNRRYLLKKGKDPAKDQTYFISFLSQEQLGQSLFPIGEYTKGEVRKMAENLGLDIVDKSESQNFVDGDYSSLVGVAQPGPILNRRGEKLGEHQGIPFYTIGQRRGLGISSRKPLYVIDINHEDNAITVGGREEVYNDEFTASGLNWISISELDVPIEAMVKIRNLHAGAEARIVPLGRDSVYVKFKEPQMAITPGQAAVFYDEDLVIGAGIIEKTRE